MAEMKKSFPDGLEYDIVYDPTEFVKDSVQEVVRTLFEAIVLVFIVVLVFLQNWRAALIPMIAVPVSLIELSSQVILHKFNSPAWLKHIQKANASLGGLTPEKMAHLRPGEAWSSKQGDRRGVLQGGHQGALPPPA